MLVSDFAEEESEGIEANGSQWPDSHRHAVDSHKTVRLRALLANLSYGASQAILVHPLQPGQWAVVQFNIAFRVDFAELRPDAGVPAHLHNRDM